MVRGVAASLWVQVFLLWVWRARPWSETDTLRSVAAPLMVQVVLLWVWRAGPRSMSDTLMGVTAPLIVQVVLLWSIMIFGPRFGAAAHKDCLANLMGLLAPRGVG